MNSRKEKLLVFLRKNGACSLEAVEPFETVEEAWESCNRGDWMAWLVGKLVKHLPPEHPERRKLTLAAVKTARLVEHLLLPADKRIAEALELAERWGNGDPKIQLDDLRSAANAATAASVSIRTGYIGGYVATCAANTARDALNAGYVAVNAARVAAYSGYSDDANYAASAEIYRSMYSFADVERLFVDLEEKELTEIKKTGENFPCGPCELPLKCSECVTIITEENVVEEYCEGECEICDFCGPDKCPVCGEHCHCGGCV